MQHNKIADYFANNPKYSKSKFINLFPNAGYVVSDDDGKEEFSSQKTRENLSELPDNEREEVLENIFEALVAEKIERTNVLNEAFTTQGEILNEQFLTEVYEYINKSAPDFDKPFEKLPFLSEEEKAKREPIQQRAYAFYLNRETEEMMCHEIATLFSPLDSNDRGLQQFFRPARLTREGMDKCMTEMEIWARIKEIKELQNINAPLSEKQTEYYNSPDYKKDRNELVKIFENRMVDIIKGGLEIASAKNDEEFLEAMEKNYRVPKLLAETGLSNWKSFLGSFGISEEDLSPEFLDFYRANAELGVIIGGAANRLSAMANPLYTVMDGADYLKFFSYLGDAGEELNGELNRRFGTKEMSIVMPDKHELNALTGYGFSHDLYSEKMRANNLESVLQAYAYNVNGKQKIEDCDYVDKDGNLVDDIEKVKEMISRGEEINMLTEENMSMVPLSIDLWSMPGKYERIPSPFYQELEKAHSQLVQFNQKLPEHLKIAFGPIYNQNNFSRDVLENLQENYSDINKVRVHDKAKRLIKMRGKDETMQKQPGLAAQEAKRLAEKFGPVPNDGNYMGRLFQFHLNLDGTDEARQYNETLYKSYINGTDEARLVFQKTIDNMLNIDVEELAEASKTIEGAVEYYSKHIPEMEMAYNLGANDGTTQYLSEGYQQFIKNNQSIFQTLGSAIRDKVDMAASNWYMADVYDTPTYKDPSASSYLFGIPDGSDEVTNFTNVYRKEQNDYETQKMAEYTSLRGESFLINTKTVDSLGKEVRKDIQNIIDKKIFVKSRKDEELEVFNSTVPMTGRTYTKVSEYNFLFNKEIQERGINGKIYQTMSEFVENNKGSWFNQKLGKDSEEYKSLVESIKLFERKQQGDLTAFPNERENKTLNTEDFTELKSKFDNYIKHKENQLRTKGKTQFDEKSTDDNRYKFALRMSNLLGKAIDFRPLNIVDIHHGTIVTEKSGLNINNVNNGIDSYEIKTNVKKENNIKNTEEDFIKIKEKDESEKYTAGEVNNEKQGDFMDKLVGDIHNGEFKTTKREDMPEKPPETEEIKENDSFEL